MTKADLRAEFRARRLALPMAEVEHRSQHIADRALAFLFDQFAERPFVLHTFLPIVRQHEVDTRPIINKIWQRFPLATVFVPVMDTAKGEMLNVQIGPNTVFVENQLGIPEPADSKTENEIPNDRFDSVLIPLLTFDQTGHRVGYGGGYYDRFLANCRPDCLKIGLSLFGPVDEISDVWPGDVPLGGCMTPDEVYVF
jgi:5-formyltetrahydrofolate cyclo-ligase